MMTETQTPNPETSNPSNGVTEQAPKKQRRWRDGDKVSPYDVRLVGLDIIEGLSAKSESDAEKLLYAQLYDERVHLPLDMQMLEKARCTGIDQAIVVYVWNNTLLVQDGRQRTKYGRALWDEQTAQSVPEADRIHLTITLYKGKVEDMFIRSRAANVVIESSPMMKARDIARLLAETIPDPTNAEGKRKRSVIEVAKALGKSEQHIRDMLRLFESSDTVKQALAKLKQPTIGLVLAGLPEDQQMKVLAELEADQKAGKKVTVEGAKKKAAEASGKKRATPADKVEDIEGALVKLAKRAASGEVKRTSESTKEELHKTIDALLAFVDGVSRTIYKGKVAFPGPIKEQPVGYTLASIAGLSEKE